MRLLSLSVLSLLLAGCAELTGGWNKQDEAFYRSLLMDYQRSQALCLQKVREIPGTTSVVSDPCVRARILGESLAGMVQSHLDEMASGGVLGGLMRTDGSGVVAPNMSGYSSPPGALGFAGPSGTKSPASFLGPYTPNAYGPGINSDATGRPFIWQPDTAGPKVFDPLLQVHPNAYGPRVGMDQYGRPVRPACPPGMTMC